PNSAIFRGLLATTEGVYFVPQNNNFVLHYRTGGDLADASSFALGGPDKSTAFFGGASAGGGLYLPPSPGNPLAARHDQTHPLTSGWSTLDLRTLDPQATQFAGAVTDGRYVYFVPEAGSAAARVDSTLPFGGLGSWAFSDVAKAGGTR